MHSLYITNYHEFICYTAVAAHAGVNKIEPQVTTQLCCFCGKPYYAEH